MMEEVFKHYGCFPFLFITGRRRSGKSTVAEWMMNLFGLENSGKQAGDTTSVAMQRYMSYYSSLPLFVDEYRNDIKVTQKNGLFRNAYNRQSAGKGIKSDWGTREAKIRGTIILAGEETPSDNALLTRCIVVLVSEIRRKVNNFDWFTRNRSKMSAFAYHILSNRKAYTDKFMLRLLEDKEGITRLVNDDRMAINMAVVSAGVWSLFGEDKVFAKQFIDDIKVTKIDQESENVVSSFFADVKAMAVQPQHKLRELWDLRDGKAYFYFHAIYNIWASDYQSRHREAPFKSDAIRNYLKDEPGFVDMSVVYRMKSGLNRCVVFNYDKAPDFIRDLFDGENVTLTGVTVTVEKNEVQQRKDLK
jgi:DNA primase